MRSLTAALTAALVLLPAAPAWAANQPPVVVDDAVSYRNIGGVDRVVPALANDSDPDGDTLTYTAVGPATKGVTFLQDGRLFYRPTIWEEGTDSFTYTVTDGQGNTATATVTATLWVDPDLPSDVAISSAAPGSATLTWSAGARAAEYRVYRDGKLVGSTPDLSWTDTGLLDTSRYRYQISSVNGGGYEAIWWHAPTVYREEQAPAPTALAVAVTEDPTTLSLTWSADERLGPWNVYRDGALLASSPNPAFEDTGLVTGREYSYQVQNAFPSSSMGVYPPGVLSAPVRAIPGVLSDIGRYVRDHGGAGGSLGPVTVPERAIPGGRQQDHQNGIVLHQDDGAPLSVTGGFASAYRSEGGATGDLGFPLGERGCGLRELGCGQFFEGGSIWESQYTRPAVVWLGIEDAWAASDWEEGPLGYPVGDLVELPGGARQAFEGGAVYWSEATGAHGVARPIYDRWGAAGYENGILGYPTSDETILSGGLFQTFTGGSIYWSPATGAQPVRGAIRTAWGRSGWERGPLGYPLTDELALRNGGRFQKFQGGSVYWTPYTGARIVRGAILGAWGRTGWERGRLGYPTSEETGSAGTRRQTFQGGTITYYVASGRQTITYR